MAFPLSHSGIVVARDVTVEDAIERLTAALRDVRAVAVCRAAQGVTFRGIAWTVLPGGMERALRAVSNGTLEVREHGSGVEVRYRITLTRLLVYTALLLAVGLVAVTLVAMPDVEVRRFVAEVWVVLCVFTFVGSFAITTWWWWPRFLATALAYPGRSST